MLYICYIMLCLFLLVVVVMFVSICNILISAMQCKLQNALTPERLQSNLILNILQI